jgi:hypothetical protein
LLHPTVYAAIPVLSSARPPEFQSIQGQHRLLRQSDGPVLAVHQE